MAGQTTVTVLGAGRVGAAMALDLAADPAFRVRAVDADASVLAAVEERASRTAGPSASDSSAAAGDRLEARAADLSDPDALAGAVGDADVVVGAVPGAMGFHTLERVLRIGRPVVDISFFEEDAFRLDGLARERGVPALVDAGLAPGLSNLVLGRLVAEWEEVLEFECLVGGLPVDRSAPFEYRAPFSPVDVLAEYVRPARLRRAGEVTTRSALSEVEEVEVPGVGRLEAFLTDGLRTLLETTAVPEMVEKTMRYPGHAAAMRGLREAGFFSRDPVQAGGRAVSPLEVTGRLLSDAWRMDEDDEDLVAMRITARGRQRDELVRRRWWLLDRYDVETGTTAMARTTGFTCTACVRLLARGLWERPGVSPLEVVGRDPECHDFIVSELADRGVMLEEAGP